MERAFRLFANLHLLFHFWGGGRKTSSKERLLPCGYKMCQVKEDPREGLRVFFFPLRPNLLKTQLDFFFFFFEGNRKEIYFSDECKGLPIRLQLNV